MSDLSVSVIIPSYNSCRTILRTVESLTQGLNYSLLSEIIIVDSSDDKATKELLGSFNDRKIRIIHSGIRIMPSIQRNIGAENAKGTLLVFIDSDACASENWLQRIVSAYSEGWKAGGGSYLIPDMQKDSKIALAQYYFEFGEFLPVGRKRIKRILPSCNLFCDRSLFLSLGGFPEIRASEDSLFCLKAGEVTDLVFIPDAGVYHIFRLDEEDFIRNQFLIGQYVYIYRRQHNNSFYLRKPFFVFLAPLMFIYKFLWRIWLVLRAGPGHYLPLIKSCSYFLQGNLSWFKGFVSGRKVRSDDKQVMAE